jgi:hypothetical protein
VVAIYPDQGKLYDILPTNVGIYVLRQTSSGSIGYGRVGWTRNGDNLELRTTGALAVGDLLASYGYITAPARYQTLYEPVVEGGG